MKTQMLLATLSLILGGALSTSSAQAAGISEVKDNVSQKNIVQVAKDSKDHGKLVAALDAADLVDTMAGQGPFTVFAPTNAAFDKIKDAVDALLKPEKKSDLEDILHHHVYVGVLETKDLKDGRVLNQVDGNDVTVSNKNGKISIDGANIIATVRASNGIIHVVDAVILPKPKKK